jgi:hypothetical protein
MRDYEPVGDRELAIRWMDEFVAEAMPEDAAHPESSAEFVDRREEDPEAGLVVWEDERPVSMAGFRRPHAERHPRRARLHAAGPARPRLRECGHRGADATAARLGAAVLLPLHRPRETRLRTASTSGSATAR